MSATFAGDEVPDSTDEPLVSHNETTYIASDTGDLAIQHLTATDILPSGPPRKLRRLNMEAHLASSNLDVAENHKATF